MPQKTNKIIIFVGIIVIISLLIWGVKIYQAQPRQPSLSLEELYKGCRVYLREPQMLSDGNSAVFPEVICKVEKGEVKLMPIDKPDIHPGDFVIKIVDVPKLFTQEYFDFWNQSHNSTAQLALPEEKVQFCVSYGPYEEKSPLTLLPNIFQPPKILNKTAIACQEMSLKYLSPIGIIGTVPQNTQGQPFGFSILLPNKDNVSYTTLYSGFNGIITIK